MARPLRIEYPGAIYHITSRGNERREIYLNDKNRLHFVRLLKEGSDFFRVEVIAYCLMSNHFHLLIQTKEGNLSRFMQRLNTAYTRHFNYKHNRVGHLFQGRFKSIVVGSDEYFLTLSRYIHLNPVKLKRYEQRSKSEKKLMIRKYQWSSYQSVLDPAKRSSYLSCEKVLDCMGGDTYVNRKKYEEYVNEGIEGNITNPMQEVKYSLLLGADNFIEEIKEKFIKKKELKEYEPQLKKIKDVKNLDVNVEV